MSWTVLNSAAIWAYKRLTNQISHSIKNEPSNWFEYADYQDAIHDICCWPWSDG